MADYYGEKKIAYHTLTQAFSPLHVMMEWPDLDGEAAGAELRKAVHVVNDYNRCYGALTVQWQVAVGDGAEVAADSIACSIPENGIAQVGAVAWEIPEDAAGPYAVRLRLAAADQHVSDNQYTVKVRPVDPADAENVTTRANPLDCSQSPGPADREGPGWSATCCGGACC